MENLIKEKSIDFANWIIHNWFVPCSNYGNQWVKDEDNEEFSDTIQELDAKVFTTEELFEAFTNKLGEF